VADHQTTDGLTELYFGLNSGPLSGGANTLALLEDDSHKIAGLVLEPATGYSGAGRVYVGGCFFAFSDRYIRYLDNRAWWENIVQWSLPAEKCLGDLDGDGMINVTDFVAFSTAFGSMPGQPNWNPLGDLNADNAINLTDFAVFAEMFGSACP
jgi:hypothetical protein